jgi:hypothetical protein
MKLSMDLSQSNLEKMKLSNNLFIHSSIYPSIHLCFPDPCLEKFLPHFAIK